MRLRVGLTGGIGSGKSEVAKAFAALGALVIDADRLARDAVAPGTPGFACVASRFPQAIDAHGGLDRAALAAIVFGDGAARDDLAAIVHPEVRRLGRQREIAARPDQIVVHDVPLLFEAGFFRFCDASVLVVADRETRVGRLIARGGLSAADIERRMAVQIDPERAVELADYSIQNNSTIAALRTQVGEIYADLCERTASVSRTSQ